MSSVLIIDDNQSSIAILLDILQEYNVSVALNAKDAFEILKSFRPDIILLDIVMPEIDGYEACRILKNSELLRDIPVLFITANKDETSIIKAFESGGVDYVTKPFNPNELLARVKTHIKLKKAMDKLSFYALRDSMTKVYNRYSIFKKAREFFIGAKKGESKFSIMVIDIDFFKRINDSYGHSVGDEVLVELSQHILTMMHPKEDYFGRLGGEEFAVVSTKPLYDFCKLAEKIKDSVPAKAYSRENITITLSIGVASLEYHDTSVDDVFNRADDRMYEVKNSTKNAVKCL